MASISLARELTVVTYIIGATIDAHARAIRLTLTAGSAVTVSGPQVDELHGSWNRDTLSFFSNMRLYQVRRGKPTAYGPAPAGFNIVMTRAPDSVCTA